MITALLVVLLFAWPVQSRNEDPFAQLRFMTGHWSGTGAGEPGTSKVERDCRFVLRGRFLHSKNVSRWAPRKENPSGEVHEDWGLFSYDKARKVIVYRQFHVEGFVNQYVMQPVSDPRTVVFVSEAIENIAPGWRAKETYHILDKGEFEEVFELAAPGKEFELYSKSHLRRK